MKNHFTKHVTERPVFLLYDGHTSLYTAQTIADAKNDDIHLYALPPHTSHFLQPLDKSVFGPFKRTLSSIIHEWMHNHPMQVVTKDILPGLICDSFASTMTVKNIKSGFRSTGIFPLDRTAVPILRETRQRSGRTQSPRCAETKKMVMLLGGIQNRFETATKKKSSRKPRVKFIPPQGGCLTSGDFLDRKIEQEARTADRNGTPYMPPLKITWQYGLTRIHTILITLTKNKYNIN